MVRQTLLTFAALALTACQNQAYRIEMSGPTMGTTYNVTVITDGGQVKKETLETLIADTLKDVNASYSNWDPKSEISRFNAQQTTESVKVSQGLQDMLAAADRIHGATDGKFDLTIKPLVNLWGFGPKGRIEKQPSDTEIEFTRQKVGQSKVITMDDAALTLQKTVPNATVDLASIAKGYGIDAVSDALIKAGAENFMVEIGGDIYVSGETERKADWKVGIERPDMGSRGLEDIVEISNMGMATSGDYRNFFEENGLRFSHIIDPKSGRPITHRTTSVSVFAETAMEADAWATALLVVGAEDGLDIATQNGLAALFIVRNPATESTQYKLVSTPLYQTLRAAGKD